MYIGILPSVLNLDIIKEIKKAILFFDYIGIPGIRNHISLLVSEPNISKEWMQVVSELHFLNQNRLLDDSFPLGSTVVLDDEEFRKMQEEMDIINKLNETTEDMHIHAEAFARFSAATVNAINKNKLDFRAVPILDRFKAPKELKLSESQVIRIVINSVPMINTNTPWEDIINFKADSDNKGKLAVLRNWNHKVLRANYSILELKDEIESYMYQYEKSLQIHKIKYRKTAVQTLILGGLEALETIGKFKASEASKKIFEVNKMKAELMNLELSATGKEVAFLYKAKELFK